MPTYYNVGAAAVNQYNRNAPLCQISVFHGYSEFKKIETNQPQPAPARGERKKITGFSHRSRKNLLKQIFSLSAYPSIFITLTYPRNYPADSNEWKRHLDNFSREIRRKFPKAWFFWKLEPQKRGAPHYHLIGALGAGVPIVLFRQYLSNVWYRICETNDPRHLKAGTQADYVTDSVGKMRSYVSKYVAKTDDALDLEEWATPGRFWGKIGEKNMPPRLAIVANVSITDFYRIRRAIRKWIRRFSPSSYNYSKRLRHIPSYHLLSSGHQLRKLIEFVTDVKLPIPIDIESIPQVKCAAPIYD